MSDNRSQDDADLPWPIARGDLDDFEALELVRDATGRLSWQNIRPPATDTYREWLPRRAKGTPPSPPPDDVADVGLDDPLAGLFDSEATSRVAREPLQSLDAPAAPALEDSVELSLTHAPASSARPASGTPAADAIGLERCLRSALDRLASWVRRCDSCGLEPLGAVASGRKSGCFDALLADDVAAPLRLSLAIASIEGAAPLRISLPPAAPQARSRAERLALLGTGALIGAMATMVFGVAWRPDERPASAAADRPSSAPRAWPSAVGHAGSARGATGNRRRSGGAARRNRYRARAGLATSAGGRTGAHHTRRRRRHAAPRARQVPPRRPLARLHPRANRRASGGPGHRRPLCHGVQPDGRECHAGRLADGGPSGARHDLHRPS